jgi:hypothetical protein
MPIEALCVQDLTNARHSDDTVLFTQKLGDLISVSQSLQPARSKVLALKLGALSPTGTI